ncbi:MAG: NUDIX hydrolase [Oscillospiraceae bacterium]|nr:NUDIX hydrolase [Oscillospiraceae bacterium]
MAFPIHIVCAAGIVENGKGEILLVKNRYRYCWEIPGGQVEEGENLIEAVVREVKEESGANVIVEKLVGIVSNTGKYEDNNFGAIPTKVIFDFICKYIDGDLCESDETSDPTWVRKDEILNYIQPQSMRERINAYINFNGNIQYLDWITRPEYNLKLKRNI